MGRRRRQNDQTFGEGAQILFPKLTHEAFSSITQHPGSIADTNVATGQLRGSTDPLRGPIGPLRGLGVPPLVLTMHSPNAMIQSSLNKPDPTLFSSAVTIGTDTAMNAGLKKIGPIPPSIVRFSQKNSRNFSHVSEILLELVLLSAKKINY